MMNLDIQRLSDENRHLIDGFSCVEADEMLSGLNAKERRRIRKHSKDMENFLRDEAYEDQEKGIGKEALQFAIYISQMVRDYSGVVFLTLDCYEHRVGYYERFGFQRNLYQPVVLDYDSPVSMRLWIDEYLAEKSDEITES